MIDHFLDQLFSNEGGYSNNPRDPGGETMWGITQRVARANGYYGPMVSLSKDFAIKIYEKDYWKPVKGDILPSLLKFEVFDMAVNAGPVTAIKLLQRALNVEDDGIYGPQTLNALKDVDEPTLLRHYQAYRIKYYTSLDGWKYFSAGWANRVANNMLAI